LGASPACGGGPGYPLVSFLPAAKKDTASIPCAGRKRKKYMRLFQNFSFWNSFLDLKGKTGHLAGFSQELVQNQPGFGTSPFNRGPSVFLTYFHLKCIIFSNMIRERFFIKKIKKISKIAELGTVFALSLCLSLSLSLK
jgi:hypothetical protein